MLDEIGGAHKLQGWDRNILTGEFLIFGKSWVSLEGKGEGGERLEGRLRRKGSRCAADETGSNGWWRGDGLDSGGSVFIFLSLLILSYPVDGDGWVGAEKDEL